METILALYAHHQKKSRFSSSTEICDKHKRRRVRDEGSHEREGTEEEEEEKERGVWGVGGREWQAYYNSSMWITLVDWEQSLVEIVF